MKKIFLSLLLVISFLFISGFSTLAESKTIAQTQEYPDFIQKVGYFNHYTHPQNVNTYEYTVYYFLDGVYLYDDFEVNEYFLITSHNIVLRKGLNRNTNSYELERMYIETESFNGTWIEIRVTLLKSFVNDNYPDSITPFFRNNSALYVIYTPIDPEEAYNEGYNDGYSAGRDDGYNEGYDEGYFTGRNDGYNDGYDVGFNDGYNSGYQNGREDGERLGYQNGYEDGRYDGYWEGRSDGYNRGYNDGYEEGYEDGYNDFNVADYFGTQNIAKDPDITYAGASDWMEPSTSIILINKGYADPNILLDKPYLIVVIKKDIYDYVTVRFDDFTLIYHYEATYHDINDYDIYVFDFSDRLNTKYRLEIRKENVTTTEQANKHLNDVKENLYFSSASRLLTSSLASQFYHFGYLVGLEENISSSDAYRIGYDAGYDRGYNEGHEDGYDQGYEDGYEQGFDYGKTVEYEQGYKDGYKQGSNDAFLNDISKWFGPMVLIVLIAGAYVTARNRRSDD